MQYYVYQLIDPQTEEIFYIGKGSGQRMYQHVKDAKHPTYCYRSIHRKIQSIFTRGQSVKYNKIICETEQQAFELEQRLIQEVGRKDLKLGTLCNLTDGGEGSSNASPESIERRAAKHRGMKRSEESKLRMSKAQNNLRRGGLVTTQAARLKMSKNRLGKRQTTDTIQKHKDNSPKRKILQLDVDYNEVRHWCSMSEASRNVGVDASSIYKSCKQNGKRIAAGFRWKYATEEYKLPVIIGQYNIQTRELLRTFNTSTEAANAVGGDRTSITHCCLGTTNTSNGFAWEYIPAQTGDRQPHNTILAPRERLYAKQQSRSKDAGSQDVMSQC